MTWNNWNKGNNSSYSGYYSNPFEETMKSEISDAILQIFRLDHLWTACRFAREDGDYYSWRWKLDSILLELNADALRMDEETKENHYIKDLEIIEREIEIAFSRKLFSKMYPNLFKKEKLLRLIQEKSGKGSKLRSSEEDGI
jgi:hypothetical protein